MNIIVFLFIVLIFGGIIQRIIRTIQTRAGAARVVDANGSNQVVNKFMQHLKQRVGVVVIAIIVLVLLVNSIVVIGTGEVAVTSLFGKVSNKVLSSGLHVINPLVSVHRFDAKTQNYTMSAVRSEGDIVGDDAIRVLSTDGLEIALDVTVLYRIKTDQVPHILQSVGPNYQDNIVRPIVRTKIRDAAVYYQAIDLYSAKRDEFQTRVFSSIENDFAARGLVLEQLLVRNIDLPVSVKAAIESKINAEQESQKYDFVLQKEKKEAERKRIEAEGQRDAQAIINQSLTDKFLYYQYINQLKDRAGTIYVPTNPSTGLPQFKDLGK